MATISNFTVNSSGVVTLTNPGTQVNPIISWTRRSGSVVPGSYALQSPTVTTYQMASGFEAGDQAQIQRISVGLHGVSESGSVFTATVPEVTPPPPTPPTITDPKATVSGASVEVTAGTSSDVTIADLTEGTTDLGSAIPADGGVVWSLTNVSAGTHTYTIKVTNAASLSATATVTATVTSSPPPPVSVVSLPTVSGTYQVGDTLTATPGVYDNAVSVTHRWTNCTTDQQGVESAQVTIPGATGETYTLQTSDVGLLVTYEETATGAAGDTVVRHGFGTTPVVAAPPPPSAPINVTLPSISGTAVVGNQLTASSGTWTGTPTFMYQWQRGTTNVSNATSANYQVTSADVGDTLQVVVTATNSVGKVSATSAATSAVTSTPPPPTTTRGFGRWWWYGQDQGGLGQKTGPINPGSTSWSDGFTTPVPDGDVTVPASQDLWGTLTTGTANSYGLPALPSSVSGQVALFEVTPAQVANIPNTGYGSVMAKIFAAFGTYTSGAYHKPNDVSGTYGTWYYLPEDYLLPQGTDGSQWINFMQFKQTQTSGQNDPQQWLEISRAGWLVDKPLASQHWVGTKPASNVNTGTPIFIINYEGNPWKRNSAVMAVPLGRWFEVTCKVTQGVSYAWTIDGQVFDTVSSSDCPVGPDSSHPAQWIFGIGNYATCAGSIYAAGSTYTP